MQKRLGKPSMLSPHGINEMKRNARDPLEAGLQLVGRIATGSACGANDTVYGSKRDQ